MAEKKREKKKVSAKDDIINRVYVLYAFFIFIGLLITIRLIWVQTADKNVDKHIALMEKNITNIEREIAHRGAILSRDGKPLAMTNLTKEPIMDFASEGMTRKYKDSLKVVKELRLLANQMALYFNRADAQKYGYEYKSADEYYKLFTSKLDTTAKRRRSVRIFPRPVVLEDWNMMRKEFPVINHSIGRVYGIEESDIRVRPYEDMGLQIIGECYNQRARTEYESIEKDSNGASHKVIRERDTLIRITSSLEKMYDSILAGKDGQLVEQRIANGFWVKDDEDSRNRKPVDGYNVVTTIDADLQLMATETLRKYLEEHCGSFGVAMVMEAATGNLLCVVNLSSSEVRGKDYSERPFNHAMRTRMSPGSTFKLMSAMALLEIGGATKHTRVHIPDPQTRVGRKDVEDTHVLRDKDGKQIERPTLVEGFAHSSNVYFATAIYDRFENNPEALTSFYESLGLNASLGLEGYNAEQSYLPLANSERWRLRHGGTKMALPQLAYGYIITLTPMHTLTFYNGVANGGKMMAPRLVDRIENNGEVVEVMPTTTLVERMCSEETVKTLYECMEAAAEPSRTSRTLVGLPIKVGCKTGTAQISGRFSSICHIDLQNFKEGFGHTEGKHAYYLGSMVAIAPLDNPKYTIMVAMAKEKTSEYPVYYGARVAGEAVKEIIDYLYTNDFELHPSVDVPARQYTPLMIKSGRSTEVGHLAENLCSVGNNEGLMSEWCSAHVDNSGTTSVHSLNITAGCVPNVVGMGLADALFLLEQQGIRVKHTGYGRVIRQSIAEGAAITEGTTIELTLSI